MLLCHIAVAGGPPSAVRTGFQVIAGLLVPEDRLSMFPARLEAIARGRDDAGRRAAWLAALLRDGGFRAVAGVAEVHADRRSGGEPSPEETEGLALAGLILRFEDHLEEQARDSADPRGLVIADPDGPGDDAIRIADRLRGASRRRHVVGGVLRSLGRSPLNAAAAVLADVVAERVAAGPTDAFEAVAPLFRTDRHQRRTGHGIALRPVDGWTGPRIGVLL